MILYKKAVQTLQHYSFLDVLLVKSGFREGEAVGIHYEDCDIVNRLINVRHSIITLNGGSSLIEPKTKTSKRAITLPNVDIVDLKKHFDQLETNQGLTLTTNIGDRLSPRNFFSTLRKLYQMQDSPI